MTGYSHSWNHNKKLIGLAFFVSGIALLIEHLYTHGGFDIEVLGHEFYGIALIVIAILINVKWRQLPALLKALKNREWLKVLDEGER